MFSIAIKYFNNKKNWYDIFEIDTIFEKVLV